MSSTNRKTGGAQWSGVVEGIHSECGARRRGRKLMRSIVEEFSQVIHSRSGGTEKSWRTDVRRLEAAATMLDVECIEELAPPDVSRMMTTLDDKCLSPKTINEYREIVQRLCNYAIRDVGIVFDSTGRTNPASLIRKRKQSAPHIEFPEREELEELLDLLSDKPQLRALAAVLAFAGLRRGELMWLTHDDVDRKRGLILVRAKTVNGDWWQPKTRKNRSVPISTRLAEELDRWPPERGPWYFPSRRGGRWGGDSFSLALAKSQARAEKRWHSLHMRHFFGTSLVRRGITLYKVSTLMGNSPEICRKHYAFLQSEDLRAEVEF